MPKFSNETWGRIAAFGGALAIGLFVIGVGLSNKPVPHVDVVTGVPPVSDSMASITDVQNALAHLPQNERVAYLNEHWPHLGEDVVHFVRSNGGIPANADVARVAFVFGSLPDVTAYKHGGGTQRGYFNNKIVALLYIAGESKPRPFIVQCTNGMVEIPENFNAAMQSIGASVPRMVFTIGPREGLIHHVDFPTAIDLADRFGLALYRGRLMSTAQLITPAQARRLQNRTDWEQVTVRVYSGDRFDLNHMTYNGWPARPLR